ncbi:hypothetical protein KR044_007623, partial [Drosophila immigrans]
KMKYAVKKSFLLISLMLVNSCQAQPLQEHNSREQRQLKSPAAAEADVKMMAASAGNMTPATTGMQMAMTGLPINQMSLQMARYPGYQGLIFGGGSAPAAPFLGVPGLQGGIANNYPSDPSLGLGYGMGAYPGNPQSAGFMYGNPMYPNAQFGAGNGFGAQPGVDNFAALNNIINMANVQGLGAAVPPTGLYPQAGVGGLGPVGGVGGVGMPIPGFLGGINADAGSSLLERMNMHHYAPAF